MRERFDPDNFAPCKHYIRLAILASMPLKRGAEVQVQEKSISDNASFVLTSTIATPLRLYKTPIPTISYHKNYQLDMTSVA